MSVVGMKEGYGYTIIPGDMHPDRMDLLVKGLKREGYQRAKEEKAGPEYPDGSQVWYLSPAKARAAEKRRAKRHAARAAGRVVGNAE